MKFKLVADVTTEAANKISNLQLLLLLQPVLPEILLKTLLSLLSLFLFLFPSQSRGLYTHIDEANHQCLCYCLALV